MTVPILVPGQGKWMLPYLKLIYLETGSLEFLHTMLCLGETPGSRWMYFFLIIICKPLHQGQILHSIYQIILRKFMKQWPSMRKCAYQCQLKLRYPGEVRKYQVEILCIICPLKVSWIYPGNLRWTGPYRVISTPSESLSVIDPIGGWAVNRRELHVLTSRLKKVNPEYSRLTSEQIDLDQLTQREAEEEEVSFTPQESLTYSTSAPSELSRPREIIVDSSEDDEEYIPMRNQWSERPLHSPENIFPSIETPREMSKENHIIVQPSMIKIEVNPDESLPQAEATLPQALDQPPVGKRKWVQRELPPPREGRGGARREAFTKARRHVQENLQKRKN